MLRTARRRPLRALHALAAATLALLAACDRRPPAPPRRAAPAWSGPDAVLVRLSLSGGLARAYRWGSDSLIWTSTQPVPAVTGLVAFDDEAGALDYVDTKGVPGRLELRLGFATPAAPTPVSRLASADGWALYGISPKQEVVRLTPSGNWTYGSALTPRLLLPQPDGSLVLVNDLGPRTTLRRLHPPEARVTDTASVPLATFAITTSIGDRIYFSTDSGLAGVRVRDLARTRSIGLPGPASAAAATPSGDRIFVALAGEPTIVVVDRYEEKVVTFVAVGHAVSALRMDPDGRYLLAERDGQDSVAVISVAEGRVIRTLHTRWRADLPLVAPDGALLMLDSTDAVDVRPTDGKIRRRYAGGARELWALIRWDGFRPRAKELDVPVNFDADSTDSTAVAATVPAAPAPAPRDEPRPDAARKAVVWTLSFAALLDEQRARALALTIRVDNKPVHVVKGTRDGVAIWRVVYGPFTTRDEAERAGRKTGLPFWVYEDAP